MLALILIISLICGASAKLPPRLPPQFISNVTLLIGNKVERGKLWFDWTNQGCHLLLNDDDGPPLEVYIKPGDNKYLIYTTRAGKDCMGISFPNASFPGFQIPADSKYLGQKNINGVDVDGWNVTAFKDPITPFQVYVALTDASVVSLQTVSDGTPVTLEFDSTAIGPFDPKYYKVPAACTATY